MVRSCATAQIGVYKQGQLGGTFHTLQLSPPNRCSKIGWFWPKVDCFTHKKGPLYVGQILLFRGCSEPGWVRASITYREYRIASSAFCVRNGGRPVAHHACLVDRRHDRLILGFHHSAHSIQIMLGSPYACLGRYGPVYEQRHFCANQGPAYLEVSR